MLSLLLALGISSGLLFQQSYSPAFPRENARKVFETERVIVWEAVWPKGQATPMHGHAYDLLAITTEEGAVKTTTPEGITAGGTLIKVGEVLYQKKGVVHMEEGVSEATRRAIVVELKDVIVPPISEAIDLPFGFAREGAKEIVNNERVVVWDYTYQLGVLVPLHFHATDGLLISLGEGDILYRFGANRDVMSLEHGVALYGSRGRIHTEQAIRGSPRVIVIELK